MDLTQQKCVPCEGGIPPLAPDQVVELIKQLDGWRVEDSKVKKTFEFKDFAEAMQFVNKVAEIAESEGHHPDIAIHYNQVAIELWTHAIGGLHQNDFIVASKIDKLIS